ncbi:hypothetical protein B0A55_07243 [Friedmanniomyces simplex]|uniref:Uncharacterized protein n=1 Tax=Friedmanniomyces simplex TaxID=329884 RepID=A0A4U0X9E8_9PEZI|nr:hypothetical protein B0A55_07243 [Friedmanniomyces simplex]
MSVKDLYKKAETSWLAEKIDKKMIRHYLNLVHVREDAVLLHGMPRSQLRSGFNKLSKDIIAIQGIPIDRVEASFAEVERWTNDNRASVMSTSSASSVRSIFSFAQSSNRTSLASSLTQSSDGAQGTTVTRFVCPTCYTSFGRSNDMLDHLRHLCEKANVARHKCLNCQHEEESKIDMDLHCIKAKKLDPQHCLGSVEMHVRVKLGFGCPHCRAFFHTTDYSTYDQCIVGYHRHLLQHAKDRTLAAQATPSKRVLASIREDMDVRTTEGTRSVAEVVESECRRRNLPRGALLAFEWDDANAAWFWHHLENGQRDESDLMGDVDVDTFFSTLVRKGHHSDTEQSALHPLASPRELRQSHAPVSSASSSSSAVQPAVAASVYNGAEDPTLSSFDFDFDFGLPTPPNLGNQYEARLDDANPWTVDLEPPTPANVSYPKRKRGLSDIAWRSQQLCPNLVVGQSNCDKPLPLLPAFHEQDVPPVNPGWFTMPIVDGIRTSSLYGWNEELPTTISPAALNLY